MQQTGRKQAVMGLPPEMGEAMIRETWPGVTQVPGVASLAEVLMRTIVLAPVAWLLLAPCYFLKILPFVAKRYTLTNRRIMIRRGLKPKMQREVLLNAIEKVDIEEGSFNRFFRTATLAIVSNGHVAMRLKGVSDPEAFRQAILNAKTAWAAWVPKPAPAAV